MDFSWFLMKYVLVLPPAPAANTMNPPPPAARFVIGHITSATPPLADSSGGDAGKSGQFEILSHELS